MPCRQRHCRAWYGLAMYLYGFIFSHEDFSSERSGQVVASTMRVYFWNGECNPPGARTALHLRHPQPCLIAAICGSGCRAYAQLPQAF